MQVTTSILVDEAPLWADPEITCNSQIEVRQPTITLTRMRKQRSTSLTDKKTDKMTPSYIIIQIDSFKNRG